MRPRRLFLGLILALATLAAPALAQAEHFSFHFVRVQTTSPVIATVHTRYPDDPGSDVVSTTKICVGFRNSDPRTARAVRFAFVYFDDSGRRISTQIFGRTGTFATGTMQGEDCTKAHLPNAHVITIAFYVDGIDFADGSTWTAQGLTLPDVVYPGSLVPVPPAPGPVAASGDLAPQLLGRYPNCAAAEAAVAVPDRSVFVDVQTGAPISDGLSHLGAVTVCAPTADPARDAAAVRYAAALPLAIVRGGAFRIIFPAVAATATCSAPPRLMDRVLLDVQQLGLDDRQKDGEYLAVAHVDVRADGFPSAVHITRSSNEADLDTVVRLSALATRYWPALTAGAPVAGAFDFPMRWLVVAPKDGTRGTIREFGPAIAPPPPECVAHA